MQRWRLWQNPADIRKEAKGPIHTVPVVSALVTGERSIDIQSSHTHECVTLSLNSNDLTKNNQDQPAMNQYNPARGDDWAHEKKKKGTSVEHHGKEKNKHMNQ